MQKIIKNILENKKAIHYLWLIYVLGLTYLLLKPMHGFINLNFFNIPMKDKIAHFTFFTVLGILTLIRFNNTNKYLLLLYFFSYGIITELLQEYMKMGREGDVKDLFADMIGILIGYIIYYIFLKKFVRLKFNL